MAAGSRRVTGGLPTPFVSVRRRSALRINPSSASPGSSKRSLAPDWQSCGVERSASTLCRGQRSLTLRTRDARSRLAHIESVSQTTPATGARRAGLGVAVAGAAYIATMLACCGAPTAKKRTASARRAVPEGRPPPSVVGDDAPPASPLGDAAAPARPLSPDEEKAKRMLKYVKQQRNTGGSVDMMLTSAELETATSADLAAADRTHSDSSSDAGSSDGWSGSDSGLGSTDSQNSQASNRSASTRQRRAARRLEKAMARAEDEAEKEQHLQRWDAPRALSLEIDRRVSAVRDIEPEVTRFLRATAKANDARMKALDTRLKSKASLTRKVLEKVSVIDNHQAAASRLN